MRKDRLKILRDFLAGPVREAQLAVKESRDKTFDMSSWWVEEGAADDHGDAEKAENCGSFGCALGWACQVESFQKDGLTSERGYPLYRAVGHASLGYTAGAEFFGIRRKLALYLFDPQGYPVLTGEAAIDEVVKRLDELLARPEPEPEVVGSPD